MTEVPARLDLVIGETESGYTCRIDARFAYVGRSDALRGSGDGATIVEAITAAVGAIATALETSGLASLETQHGVEEGS